MIFMKRRTLDRLQAYNRGLGFAIGINYATRFTNLPAGQFAQAFADSFMAGTSDVTIDFFKKIWPSVKDEYL